MQGKHRFFQRFSVGLIFIFTGCGDGSPAKTKEPKDDTLQTITDTLTLVEGSEGDTLPSQSDSVFYSTPILSFFNPAEAIITNPDSVYVYQTSVNGKYGYKDRSGKIIIRPKFDVATNFFGNHAVVVYNGKHGFCDTSGKITYLKNYLFAFHVSELSGETFLVGCGQGLVAVTDKNNKYGFMNYSGDIVIPCKYDNAQYFSNGLAAVSKNGKFGFIDMTGKTVIGHTYDDVNFFSDNRACVKIGNKYGYINKKGEMVIPAVYEHTYYFSEGLAYVSKADLYNDYYYIDTTGKTVIKGLFEQASPFEKGKAIIMKNGKCFEIDPIGKKLKYLGTNCFEGC